LLFQDRANAVLPVWLETYEEWGKFRKQKSGRSAADKNKRHAVIDDLRIANVFLTLLYDKKNQNKQWNSLDSLANKFLDTINNDLPQSSLFLNGVNNKNVSVVRLKSVIKEINHVDKTLLAPFVEKPIPVIHPGKSEWLNYFTFGSTTYEDTGNPCLYLMPKDYRE